MKKQSKKLTSLTLGNLEINLDKFTKKNGKEERIFGRDLCKLKRNQVNIQNNQKDLQKEIKTFFEKKVFGKSLSFIDKNSNRNQIYQDDDSQKENMPQNDQSKIPKPSKPTKKFKTCQTMAVKKEAKPKSKVTKRTFIGKRIPKEMPNKRGLNEIYLEKKPLVTSPGRSQSSKNFFKSKLFSKKKETKNQRKVSKKSSNPAVLLFEEIHRPEEVLDYQSEIFSELKSKEEDFLCDPDYMDNQADLTDLMRSILIDWIIELVAKFNLLPETLFLTVNIIDRYLSLKTVKRDKLQLVGVSALFIAGKYQEIYPPDGEKYIDLTDGACTEKEMHRMEFNILSALDFNVTVNSPLAYLDFIRIKFGFEALEDLNIQRILFENLLNGETKGYSPFQTAIAASAIVCPKLKTKLFEFYGKRRNFVRIEECMKEMMKTKERFKKEWKNLKGVNTAFTAENYYYARYYV
ncbi:MAG: hypothetical protein MJ252_27835 [archaeon]|nr:hypothetical protein [archaeon]